MTVELFFSCFAELLVAVLDAWLTHKVFDSRRKRRAEPEESRFNFWLTLLTIGLVVLVLLLIVRITGYSPFG